jgi:hypothetical protein
MSNNQFRPYIHQVLVFVNPLVDVLHQSRTQLDTQRLLSSQDWITDSNAGCLFVNLNGGFIGVNTDDLCVEWGAWTVLFSNEKIRTGVRGSPTSY